MAEYFNQFNVGIREITTFQFNHVMNDGETDVVACLVYNVEMLPNMAKVLQDTYDAHKTKMADDKRARETNRSLS